MNTLTRGEKIDRALEAAKAWFIRMMLIIWAILTLSLGLGFMVSSKRCDELEKRLERVESEYTNFKESVDAIYVFHR